MPKTMISAFVVAVAGTTTVAVFPVVSMAKYALELGVLTMNVGTHFAAAFCSKELLKQNGKN